MLKDGYEMPINIGDTVLLKDGCLCFVRDILTYELAVELLLEDKLTHSFRMAQPRDVMKL